MITLDQMIAARCAADPEFAAIWEAGRPEREATYAALNIIFGDCFSNAMIAIPIIDAATLPLDGLKARIIGPGDIGVLVIRFSDGPEVGYPIDGDEVWPMVDPNTGELRAIHIEL